MMVRFFGFLLVTFLSVFVVWAKCPGPGLTLCNCTEGQKSDELLVFCDGLSSVPEVKYQLDGIPLEQITELAILRTKNLEGFRPDFFDPMKRLTRLSLAANPNSKLRFPPGIFEKIASHLETLDLSTSSLTERDLIPEIFTPLTQLKELDLSFNQITQLRPEVLAPLKNLETLDLSDNKLSFLPPYFLASHNKLKMLDLCNNQLNEFPMDLFDDMQPTLKILDIGGNRIKDLGPDHFALMPNLTVLDLRKNQISPLVSNLFSRNKQLQSLIKVTFLEQILKATISSSGISLDGLWAPVIPPTIFDGLPLESLDLSDVVNLRSFPENLLSSVGSTLKELHLDDNWKLTSLPPKFFQGLDALEILDLGNTSLSLLPTTFFSDLKSLRKLKISENPFLISLPPPRHFSDRLKIIDWKGAFKLPPVVTKWINNNFDTRPQLMDFPINIYRSVLREIKVRYANNEAAARQSAKATTRRYNHNDDNNYNSNNDNNRW